MDILSQSASQLEHKVRMLIQQKHYCINYIIKAMMQQVTVIMSHVYSSPASMRSTLAHSGLWSLNDMPFDTFVDMRRCGFTNVGCWGKWLVFKAKYVGVVPSPQDSAADVAVILNVREMVNDSSFKGFLEDALVLFANMNNVLGISPKWIEDAVVAFWKRVDKHVKKTGRGQQPKTAPVNQVQWVLSGEQEHSIYMQGVGVCSEELLSWKSGELAELLGSDDDAEFRQFLQAFM